MEIKAWIQMGCERREVQFAVSEAEVEAVGEEGLEAYIEDAVLDWINCRFGWGWVGAGFENDFSFTEDCAGPSLVVTKERLNPATRRMRVQAPSPG